MKEEGLFDESAEGVDSSSQNQEEPVEKAPNKKASWRKHLRKAFLVAGITAGLPAPEPARAQAQDHAVPAAEHLDIKNNNAEKENGPFWYEAQKNYDDFKQFESKLKNLGFSVAWDDNGVMMLPRQVAAELKFIADDFFSHQSKGATLDAEEERGASMSLLAKDLEVKCGELMLRCLKESELKDFYQGQYPIDPDIVPRLDPEIVSVLLQRNTPKTVTLPRYAQLTIIRSDAKNEKNFLLVTIYLDQKEGKAHIQREPLPLKAASTKEVSLERIAESAVKKLAALRRITPTLAKGQAVQPLTTKALHAPAISAQQEEFSASDQAFLLEPLRESFTPGEASMLEKLRYKDLRMRFFFDVGDSGGSQESYNLAITIEQLKALGKLRFRHLHTLFGGDKKSSEGKAQFSIYPDIFEKYEQSGVLDSSVYLRGDGGGALAIGSLDLGNVAHQNIDPYHYYEIREIAQQNKLETQFDIKEIARQVAEIEELFGRKPGGFIKRIIADDASPGSGGTYRSAVDTLAIFADRSDFVFNADQDIFSVARHEAFHAIDDRFNITEGAMRSIKAGEFASTSPLDDYSLFWSTTKDSTEEMFRELAEGHLDRYNPKIDSRMGHPFDNKREFFASLINSLFVQQEESVFLGKSIAFLEWYKEALQVTYQRMDEINELKNTPVMNRIEEWIAKVDGILGIKWAQPKN